VVEAGGGTFPEPLPIVSALKEPPSDATWSERVRSGDHEAFRAMFEALYPSLCSLVARRVGSRAIAEELVQDVFLRVWERRGTLDPEQSITGYLYRAARNQASNHLKHRGIADRSRHTIVVNLRPAETAADEEVRYNEIAGAAQEAIDELPARCREIFLLSRHAELSYGEIARLLGLSVKTVETQMGRALKVLRARLLPFLRP
jgi:RNA polymerase sigma-70 factor, ECF subfamily